MNSEKHRRIYTIVRGGLGNQLFIYAAARALSRRIGGEIMLITDSFKDEFHGRRMLLGNYPISFKTTSFSAIPPHLQEAYRSARRINRYAHFLGRHTGDVFIERRKRLFSIRSREYDPRFSTYQPAGDCLADGFFQHEKYFVDIKDELTSALRNPSFLSSETKNIAMLISNTPNSVAIHFRRTELEKQEIEKKHGIKGLKYDAGLGIIFYKEALKALSKYTPTPHIYAFSDYPEWMLNNINLEAQTTFITHNDSPDRAHEDLYLMSLCRHHIISHSTFSWWAAWLGSSPEQKVIAPTNTRNKSPFYPENWETLDAK